MRKILAALTVAALLVTAAMAQKTGDKKGGKQGDPEAARAALIETEREFAKTGAAKDIEAFLGFLAADAHMFAAGEMKSGKDAFRQAWSAGFADPNWSITWEPALAEVSHDGTLGYTTGPYEMKSRGPDGKPVIRRGRFVTIWHKQPDGKWKVALDIGSPAPPQKSSAQ